MRPLLNEFACLGAKRGNDDAVERLVVAPPGELVRRANRREVGGPSFPTTVAMRRHRQPIEQTGPEHDGSHGPKRRRPAAKETREADRSWRVSTCEGDGGNGAHRSSRSIAESEPRAAMLFHVGGGKAQNAGEVGRRLIVHVGETAHDAEDLHARAWGWLESLPTSVTRRRCRVPSPAVGRPCDWDGQARRRPRARRRRRRQ
jgi:hypothetical protein